MSNDKERKETERIHDIIKIFKIRRDLYKELLKLRRFDGAIGTHDVLIDIFRQSLLENILVATRSLLHGRKLKELINRTYPQYYNQYRLFFRRHKDIIGKCNSVCNEYITHYNDGPGSCLYRDEIEIIMGMVDELDKLFIKTIYPYVLCDPTDDYINNIKNIIDGGIKYQFYQQIINTYSFEHGQVSVINPVLVDYIKKNKDCEYRGSIQALVTAYKMGLEDEVKLSGPLCVGARAENIFGPSILIHI